MENIDGTANIISLSVTMPTSLLLLVTGKCFILARFMSCAASSTVASSSIVINGEVATIAAVIELIGTPYSNALTNASLVVMIPIGLSP